jgi:hypothetical protein
MANKTFTLKRIEGANTDTLYPLTTWGQVLNKPSTFTPTAHTHVKADITDFSHTHGNIQNNGTMGGSSLNPGSGVNILVSGSDNTIGKSTIAFTGGGTGFLRQDGSWATPSSTDTNNFPTSLTFSTLSGTLTLGRSGLSDLSASLDGRYALSSHTHSAADITSGTLGTARGGTGSTSYTAGGLIYVNQGGTGFVSSGAASQNQIPRATGYNGVNYIPVWESPVDSSTRAVISSSSSSIPTERDVYWGTRYIHLGVTTTAGQNVSRTISFTTGMKNFILQLHQDSTTGAVIARLPLTISNSGGTSTDTDVYSLDTSTRTHRVSWSNGTTGQIMNVSISYSGTTITVSQSFNFNCAFRLFGF